MKLTSLTTVLIAVLITGCATIQPRNIVLNQKKGFYEYRLNAKNSIALRDKNQQLVDTSNYKYFREELADIKNRYPFKARIEKDGSLKKSDFEIAKSYGKINRLMIDGNYQQSLVELNKLRLLYPDIYKYTDVDYLKGTAYEQLGLADSAQVMYDHFLKYSSQKFSSRFRGHRDEDLNDGIFITERNHAKSYLLNKEQTTPLGIAPFEPKYYYASHQPGFTLNSEDIAKNSYGMLMLMFGSDTEGDLTSGFQYYYKINERFNLNPRFATSGNMSEYTLAFPIQVYKTENNQFGFKFTPFVNFLTVDSMTIEQRKYAVNEHFLNVGARISAGYYPYQHLAIGAYYQMNLHDKNNPYQSTKSQIQMWVNNEYDVSMYYNISKGFSLKSGIKNDDMVAGIVWGYWEILYNITTPGMIFRVDMY
ncbi:MAG TPA: hypothetical protein VK205_04930 [Prolixibacteraceae bacterium]|nr:hypothetical protein [Prolixibacteraceae bacterium]